MRGSPWYWAALAAAAAALFWVANGIAGLEATPGYAGHYYESLVDGFRHGHTSLAVAPAPELLRLQDPYDPRQNAPYRLADASLYRGKYYLYYGPTPAVALMLPWRVLTGRHIPERLAAVVFATLALAGLGRLLWEVRDRHFPGLPSWALAAILLVALHAAWLPVTLRRASFWELPHAAALACLWWTLYFLWRCRLDRGKAGWALAVGGGLVLLLGSRPTYLFAAGMIAALAAAPSAAFEGLLGRTAGGGSAAPASGPHEASRPEPFRWRAGWAVAGSLALGGAALILYNVLRFGRPGEFGQSYQLLNVNELHVQHFQPGFVTFNAWLYLASLPELSPYFPFVRTVWPNGLPPGYVMAEEMHGAFFALPVHFAGWAAIAWAWARRREAALRPLTVTLLAGAAASLLAAAVLFSWAGACSRYLTELTGGWTFVTSLGLMVLFAPAGEAGLGSWRRPLRLFAAAAAAWTVAYVWLASFEHGGLFRHTDPKSYSFLARTLDYPSFWIARHEGAVFGPVELTVDLAPFRKADSSVLLASGRPDMMNRLVLSRLDRDHARLSLLQNDAVVVEIQPLLLSGPRLSIRVEAPWLYPPIEHPYWDHFAELRARAENWTRFALSAGGQSVCGHASFAFDPTGFDPFVLSAGRGTSAWVASLRRVSGKTSFPPDPASP